jgi:hypothetical protein
MRGEERWAKTLIGQKPPVGQTTRSAGAPALSRVAPESVAEGVPMFQVSRRSHGINDAD